MIYPKRKNINEETRHRLVIVGSKNPVKISCADRAFHAAFDTAFIVEGVNASSEIEDQPFGDDQTYTGANNRAKNAKKIFPEADFWVGIEGGLEEQNGEMAAFAWVVVLDRDDRLGKAKTAVFFLPAVISDLVRGGLELGAANDRFFHEENSKQGDGAVGLLTNGAINRREYYKQAVVLALIPFVNENLYP